MHTIICGVTLSGKTTLARALARHVGRQRQNVIVYDPVMTATQGGDWGKSAVVFNDPQKFWGFVSRDDVGHAHIFIDEAGDLFHLGARENFWLLTRGRHFGFQVYLISQRPKMIAPSARTQCGMAYMFRLARDDAKEIWADAGKHKVQTPFKIIGTAIGTFVGAGVQNLAVFLKHVPTAWNFATQIAGDLAAFYRIHVVILTCKYGGSCT